MRCILLVIISCVLLSCGDINHEVKSTSPISTQTKDTTYQNSPVFLVVLGNVQDAGSPQIGCAKTCCEKLFETPETDRKIVALGLVDREADQSYLFEATPDIVAQTELLGSYGLGHALPNATFLTHAHIGHYAGLIHLGKEAMNAENHPVYTMPRMKSFLENNGPWEQLVTQKNIIINELNNELGVQLNQRLRVAPILVPHRDEYSETVGFKIYGPNKTALFIPDIDKWDKWKKNIVEEVKSVDYAFLDATFFDGEEINNRDISEIPHPFVVESMQLFGVLSPEERSKIVFIHFNHTNPLLNPNSKQSKTVINAGYKIARFKDVYWL